MNVLMISPGYPFEMSWFTRGLAEAGARVFGLGDQPEQGLGQTAREALSGYLRVPNLWDEAGTAEAVRRWAGQVGGIDQVECVWEPGMILAARIREALGVPGLSVERTVPFRDKGRMKEVLEAAGIRVPRHRRATTDSGVRAAVEELGYPLIVKPIAGAGSADTHRLREPADLERVLPQIRHVKEVSVEEFIEGEEFTFDTVCGGGRILFENVSWYRPNPLIQRTEEWVSPQTVALKDLSVPPLQPGIRLGRRVIEALGYGAGFTHMEWFLTPKGEAVFGEIGARAPGARSVDVMNWCTNGDLYRAWGEAVVRGRISQPLERRYNAAIVFKRAQGRGTIREIVGLERLRAEFGGWLVAVELLPVGARRRDWKQTLLSDGFVVVRHPVLETCLGMADRVGTDLQLFAG